MRVSVRSWAVRGLILAGVAAVAAAGWVATTWVSPERVRGQVIAALADQLDGVEVRVGCARMRLLGGVAVTDLTLTRAGDDKPFLVVPSAVVHPDKERLNRGRLVVRKVELENPELHLIRSADGRWNVAEVMRAGPVDRPVPTFVATGATLTVTDHAPGGLPPVRLTGARLSLLNDPLPVLTVHAQGAADGFGPVEVRARVNRITRQAAVGVELADFPIGEVAGALAERFAPLAAPHLARFVASGSVKADLTYTPDDAPAWRHDVRVEVRAGRLDHADLPWPVEGLAAKVRSADGRVKVEEATAKVGPARVRVSLETRDLTGKTPVPQEPGPRPPLDSVEDYLQSADATAAGVRLDDALLDRLGAAGATVKRLFAPTGAADLGYKFVREAAGWRRDIEVRPQGIGIVYEKFRYPVADVSGWVRRTATHRGDEVTEVDLRGKAAKQAVTAKGKISGAGRDPGIDLRITGTNVPLDDALVAALPDQYPGLVRQFRAAGRADFVATIAQKPGVNLCENEFLVTVRDATVDYARFPYKLDRVKGQLLVRVAVAEPRPGDPPPPDRDEIVLDRFTAAHGDATVWVHGSKRPVPGSRDRKLVLHLGGDNCGVDADLRAALGGMKLDGVWAALSPRGTLRFAADVEVTDRGPSPAHPGPAGPSFDPAADLQLTFNFSGPAVTPGFFPYDLSDLSGWLEYRHGQVTLAHLGGRHGEARVRLSAGEVRFYPNGAVWANLGRLEVQPLVADAALLRALPPKLRAAAEELKLRGRADLTINHLVVLAPPDPPGGGAVPPPEPLPLGPVVRLLSPPAGEGSDRRSPGEGKPGAAVPLTRLASLRDASHPLPQGARVMRVVARAQSPQPLSYPTPVPAAAADPVVYWDADLKLTGAGADAGVTWDDLFGGVNCRGRYEGTHLGPVTANVWLDRAVAAGQPLTDATGHVQVKPQRPDPDRPGEYLPPVLEFPRLSAGLFHGTVGGEARVALADPPQYQIWLTLADVQLNEVARHYKLGSDADLKGIAQAQLHVYNRPDPRTGRWRAEGAGTVDVPTGRMYNLPVLLDLVKVLKLQAPDKTAFEEAHAVFRVVGDRVKVDQLDLIGKAMCVGGSGEVDTAGEYVRFEFYTVGSQLLARLANTPVGDLTAFLSRNLFKIKLARDHGSLKFTPEPVPVLTEPARAILDRIRNRTGSRKEAR